METGGDKFVMEMVAKEHTSSQKGERALGRTAVNFIIVAVIVICFSQVNWFYFINSENCNFKNK